MKREILATLSLIALIALSAWNTHYIHDTTELLRQEIMASRKCFEAEDYSGAEEKLRQAIDSWLYPQSYTYISLRSGEIDSITDHFYNLLSHIIDESPESLGVYEQLISALHRIAEMETPTLGSIF